MPEAFDDELRALAGNVPTRPALRRPALALTATVLVSLLAFGGHGALSTFRSRLRGSEGLGGSEGPVVTASSFEEDTFIGEVGGDSEFPWENDTVPHCGVAIELTEVLHSNFGNQGPDGGEEGIVYAGIQTDDLVFQQNLTLEIHALQNYTSASAASNGLYGSFGSIIIDSGSEGALSFGFYDENNESLNLSEFSITFYDLDEAENDSSQEYIVAYGPPSYTLFPGSTVSKHDHGNSIKFMSGVVGSASDNLMYAENLTTLQKRRFVSLHYKNFDSVNITMGATEGGGPRGVYFALENERGCKDVRVPTTTTTTTTTTTSTLTTTTKVLLLLMCCCCCCGCFFLLYVNLKKSGPAASHSPLMSGSVE